jgi:hypothetical protein
MKPRYEPMYDPEEFSDVFVGYVEEFDMYIDTESEGEHITILGPEKGDYGTNHDVFYIINGVITSKMEIDLNITPYHMCLIYAKAIEHGLIKEQTDEA